MAFATASLPIGAQFFKDLSIPFYGANRSGARVSQGLMDSFWLQGMQAGFKAAFDCIKAFSETDFTEDLKKIDVPTLILHGDDDQIVPIGAAALLSSKLVKGATLKVYPGLPHGMCSTQKELINVDLQRVLQTQQPSGGVGPLMSLRPVKRLIQSKPTLEGAGVHLRRAFGFGNTSEFDPFLLLDDFRNDVPDDYLAGFPWHPHRGIETITYVLAGEVAHSDSMGNEGSIAAGDVQWMTAGRGIIHQEMPKGDASGRMHGFQLWANLPASLKMTDPRYQEVKEGQIPLITDDDGTQVRLVCGKFWGKTGPVDGIAADPIYLDVTVAAGSKKDSTGGDDPTCVCLRILGCRKILQRVWPALGTDRAGGMGRRGRSRRGRGRLLLPETTWPMEWGPNKPVRMGLGGRPVSR